MCFYKFENKSARILHISLGDGQTLAIPPTEGGITIEVDDADKPKFQANIATPAVQAWITDGQLTITEVEETPPPEPEVEGEGGVLGAVGGDPPPDALTPDATPDVGDEPHKRGHKRGRHEGE